MPVQIRQGHRVKYREVVSRGLCDHHLNPIIGLRVRMTDKYSCLFSWQAGDDLGPDRMSHCIQRVLMRNPVLVGTIQELYRYKKRVPRIDGHDLGAVFWAEQCSAQSTSGSRGTLPPLVSWQYLSQAERDTSRLVSCEAVEASCCGRDGVERGAESVTVRKMSDL